MNEASQAPPYFDVRVRTEKSLHDRLLTYCESTGATKAAACRVALMDFLERKLPPS